MISDVVIVGAGVMGLWAAHYAADAGMSVTLIDQGAVGSGGSRGVLGALAPHLPDSSNDKKRFHWQALDALPELISGLEEQTGMSTGYGQTGRLMPIRVEGFAKRMQRCVRGAPQYWQMEKQQYRFEKIDVSGFENWINADFAPMGLAHDTLSARVAPRRLTAVLKSSLEGRVTIIEGFSFGHFDEATGRVVSRDGSQSLTTNNLVLSAGYQTYELLKPIGIGDLGHGVKGHSALFRLEEVADLPALYDNGVYVVPHADGTVAVGSSSQNEWSDADQVEADQCTSFIERAMALCPRLKEAELVERWAGVRPRCFAKDPMVGQLCEGGKRYVLTGGFKISFGIAHALAGALIEQMTGDTDPLALPVSYGVAYHRAEAKVRAERSRGELC